jgi:hypothetical protein
MVKLVVGYVRLGRPVHSFRFAAPIGVSRMMDPCFNSRTNQVPFIDELIYFAKNLQFLNIGTTIASYSVWVLDFF